MSTTTRDVTVEIKAASDARNWADYHRFCSLQFAHQKATNQWPADTCARCQNLGMARIGGAACCQSYGHHHGGLCLHCGDDERNPREWRFR